jgi:hypothetical protein
MQTYYEKVLNRMRRPVLLVAVALVALLAASGIAVAVTSTDEGRNGRAVKVAAPDGSTRADVPVTPATTTAYRSVSITIPSGSGTKRIASSVTFNSNVRSAAVALNGFNLDYSNSDHHINVIEADLDIVQISGRTVFIAADTRYADVNFDDSYSGFVTAVVIANVE